MEIKQKIKDIKEDIGEIKIIEDIKDIPKYKIKEVLNRQFFIRKGEDIIISGAGRIIMFLILSKGSFKKQYEEDLKRGLFGRAKEMLMFDRARKHFKIKVNYKESPNIWIIK